MTENEEILKEILERIKNLETKINRGRDSNIERIRTMLREKMGRVTTHDVTINLNMSKTEALMLMKMVESDNIVFIKGHGQKVSMLVDMTGMDKYEILAYKIMKESYPTWKKRIGDILKDQEITKEEWFKVYSIIRETMPRAFFTSDDKNYEDRLLTRSRNS